MFCVFFTEMLLWNRKSQQSEPQNQTVCFFFFLAAVWLKPSESSRKETGRKPSFCCDQNLKGSRDILPKTPRTLGGKRKRRHKLTSAARVRVTGGFLQLWQTRSRSVFQMLTAMWWLELRKWNQSLVSLKLLQEESFMIPSNNPAGGIKVSCCKPRICCDDTEPMVLVGFGPDHASGQGQGEAVF